MLRPGCHRRPADATDLPPQLLLQLLSTVWRGWLPLLLLWLQLFQAQLIQQEGLGVAHRAPASRRHMHSDICCCACC